MFAPRREQPIQEFLKEFSTRMKRSFAVAIILASGLALNAAAQVPSAPADPASHTTAPAGPAKIAVIAFQVAVAQTNEGQRNFADLQKKYDPKRQQLKTLSDEIDSLTKQLQTQGDKLSETERASRAKTIDDKKKQLQRDAEDAQNDLQRRDAGGVQRPGFQGLRRADRLCTAARLHAGAGHCAAADAGALRQRIDQHHQGQSSRPTT